MSESSKTNSQNINSASFKLNTLLEASIAVAMMESESEIIATGWKSIRDCGYGCVVYSISEDVFELPTELSQQINPGSRFPARLELKPNEIKLAFPNSEPILVQDIADPITSLPQSLLMVPQQMGYDSGGYAVLKMHDEIHSLFVIGAPDVRMITQEELAPISTMIMHLGRLLEKLEEKSTSNEILENTQKLAQVGQKIHSENNLQVIFSTIHEQVQALIGDTVFNVALLDKDAQLITFPYAYEQGEIQHIDSVPSGDGLTSVVIQGGEPVMLVENSKEQAVALGAKIVGPISKSWLGVPLKIEDEVIGAITIQDADHEHRFDDGDLQIITTLSTQISGAINHSQILGELQKRAIQLEAVTQIAGRISGTSDKLYLLKQAAEMVQERFDYSHVGIFLMDGSGENAIMRAGTGEAGIHLVEQEYSFEKGSQSVVGHVTASGSSLIVNDISNDPLFNYNAMLPDTKAQIGIPLKIGTEVIGVVDIQSTQPFSFTESNIDILQIVSDQLAVEIQNAELINESQDHLALQQIINHASISTTAELSLSDALKNTSAELFSTLGYRIAILLLEPDSEKLRVAAAAGYESDVLGMQIELGEGITGWAADTRTPVNIGNVKENSRYVSASDSVQSEVALPIVYRDELIGILNVESDEINAISELEQEILNTMANTLAAKIINIRLMGRQKQLFEITNNIRRSVDIESILETTTNELSRALQTRKASIEIGLEAVDGKSTNSRPGYERVVRLEGQQS